MRGTSGLRLLNRVSLALSRTARSDPLLGSRRFSLRSPGVHKIYTPRVCFCPLSSRSIYRSVRLTERLPENLFFDPLSHFQSATPLLPAPRAGFGVFFDPLPTLTGSALKKHRIAAPRQRSSVVAFQNQVPPLRERKSNITATFSFSFWLSFSLCSSSVPASSYVPVLSSFPAPAPSSSPLPAGW